ncbi:hypothetical protein ACFSM5_20395 [Lacibacterium aquatile]|uniref:PH domain-containing protein n=1 Tax=Lacibacterium aquatile TaxID=1168082 RepID=A0ABW5DXL8_9PROT
MTTTDFGVPYLAPPPEGVTVARFPDGFEIRSTTRSAATVLIAGFAIAWLIAGLMAGMRIEGRMGVAVAILLLLIGLILLGVAATSYFSAFAIGKRGSQGWVTHGTGLGKYTERFSWTDFSGIVEGVKQVEDFEASRPAQIPVAVLQGSGRQMVFADQLSSERRRFVIQAISHFCGWCGYGG